LEHADQKAAAYCNKVKPMFDDIRECCDEIERVCDDAEWTLPKYRELLSLS
jgi:glutamine synthetase